MTPKARTRPTNSCPSRVENRRFSRPVTTQSTPFARRVRALEDPVLPSAQGREDLRFHGLRSGKSKIGLEPGQRIGREACPLLKKNPNFVSPIDFVQCE